MRGHPSIAKMSGGFDGVAKPRQDGRGANENLRRRDQAKPRACAAAERREQAAIFASPAPRNIRGVSAPSAALMQAPALPQIGANGYMRAERRLSSKGTSRETVKSNGVFASHRSLGGGGRETASGFLRRKILAAREGRALSSAAGRREKQEANRATCTYPVRDMRVRVLVLESVTNAPL
jgi:hypothetical protein